MIKEHTVIHFNLTSHHVMLTIVNRKEGGTTNMFFLQFNHMQQEIALISIVEINPEISGAPTSETV